MKERERAPSYDHEERYQEPRGFALGDYWNLRSGDRPATPERFKVLLLLFHNGVKFSSVYIIWYIEQSNLKSIQGIYIV